MIARGYFDHDSPEGEDPGGRLRRAGIRFDFWGENLSMDQTVARAHAADMAEPREPGTHHGNILDRFSLVGIAVERLSDGQLVITVLFVRP
jgi:uncharacterized protein YkwD